jgi:uncharacterized membrane protein YeaQ/YmgE (transglycosylase-associated protein family)
MTLPSALFALLCALLIGAIFHVMMDGGPGRLMLYMFLSVAGFAVGQWLASSQEWRVLPVGWLQMGPAVVGSLLLLVIGHWLSKVRVQARDRDGTV